MHFTQTRGLRMRPSCTRAKHVLKCRNGVPWQRSVAVPMLPLKWSELRTHTPCSRRVRSGFQRNLAVILSPPLWCSKKLSTFYCFGFFLSNMNSSVGPPFIYFILAELSEINRFGAIPELHISCYCLLIEHCLSRIFAISTTQQSLVHPIRQSGNLRQFLCPA